MTTKFEMQYIFTFEKEDQIITNSEISLEGSSEQIDAEKIEETILHDIYQNLSLSESKGLIKVSMFLNKWDSEEVAMAYTDYVKENRGKLFFKKGELQDD